MRRLVIIAALIALIALPAIADNYVLRVATTMLMYSALALGWNFIGGVGGSPSLATPALFRARRLSRRRAADQGLVDGGGLGARRRHRRVVRGRTRARDLAFARALFR